MKYEELKVLPFSPLVLSKVLLLLLRGWGYKCLLCGCLCTLAAMPWGGGPAAGLVLAGTRRASQCTSTPRQQRTSSWGVAGVKHMPEFKWEISRTFCFTVLDLPGSKWKVSFPLTLSGVVFHSPLLMLICFLIAFDALVAEKSLWMWWVSSLKAQTKLEVKEYPELEETHKNHRVQLLTPHRAT